MKTVTHGFILLFFLSALYGTFSALAYWIIHSKFIKPLGPDAPADRFSEARAIEHVRVLTEFDRQEGHAGLLQAAKYIQAELEMMKNRSHMGIRIDVEESIVNGSFSMVFLGHSVTTNYRSHINIIMRLSTIHSLDTDQSVLLNGHFDSPLGSPGAGDCGSCVASMLEVARVIIDSGWIPPHPIIFLFNGAEELFLLGAHGFMKTHRLSKSIGLSINIEASGTGGPDLVCQSGPTSWPSLIYAKAALHPMAQSAAQDLFAVIPGDTDYRIFSKDYGRIPGLDIIFLIGGYYYHTSYDTWDKLIPGSMQARGDNLISIIKAISDSHLLLENDRVKVADQDMVSQTTFFDYLTMFMVVYSRRMAVLFFVIQIVVFLISPLLVRSIYPDVPCHTRVFFLILKGMLLHALGVSLAVILPVTLSFARLLLSDSPMVWFAHPYLAFLMFIPCSLAGLLIPGTIWDSLPHIQFPVSLMSERLAYELRFWGTFGFYTCITSVYLISNLNGGYLTFLLTVFMLLAWISHCVSLKFFHRHSLRSTFSYIIPLSPCLTYCVYLGGFLLQFLIEKTGMMGSFADPYGYYAADCLVSAIVGIVVGLCVGPVLPICSYWLARASILQSLLHLSVASLALSSQFFPYSKDAPKRVLFQHTIFTADASKVTGTQYDFAVVDSNSLLFLLNHSPEVSKELEFNRESPLKSANVSERDIWVALFPVSYLFSRSFSFSARNHVPDAYKHFPYLSAYKPEDDHEGNRRIYMELSLGDLKAVWVTVLNITGPLSGWSFAENTLPAPEAIDGGPPSYISRFTGKGQENWTFWLEAHGTEKLNIHVAVVDQATTSEAKKLKALFPEWADVTAYSSFMSRYSF